MDELKSVLHEIVEHLHQLTPQLRGELHAKLDHAGEHAPGAPEADPVKPPEVPVVAPPAK